MVRGRSRAGRRVASVLAVLGIGAAFVVPAAASGPAGAAAIPRPEGAGPPVAASGMGTQAALDNPRCTHDDPKFGPYGSFDTTQMGGGAPCVKVWKAGADNGGATSQGVTKDKVTVVAVIQNDEQKKKDPVAPKHRADKSPSTYQNSLYDYLLPSMRFYETWGRDIEVKFVTSSGDDEAAQRADLVAIKAMKPFAAIMYAQPPAGHILEEGLASAKIVVMGYAATAQAANEQAPYRWNSADGQSATFNSAEVVGKQLVGKKAQYGGDDVKDQVRKFGVTYYNDVTDYEGFTSTLAKYKGKVTAAIESSTSTDPNEIAAQAATNVTKMKAAGVTTVVALTANVKEMMQAADKQEWTPEWFITGVGYADLAILARGYPTTQSQHAFGMSAIPAWTEDEEVTPPAVPYTTQIDPLNWYWGVDIGTSAERVSAPLFAWLLPGIQAAGPKLTPKTFEQGLFAIPPRGGALEGRVENPLLAYGKGPKLPYDEYGLTGLDFAPFWFDPDTTGPSNGVNFVGKGVDWFPDGGKRYVATQWPTKPIKWFDKQGAIYHFTSVSNRLGYVGDCDDCPSSGAPGSPDAPSDSSILFAAGGTGASAT